MPHFLDRWSIAPRLLSNLVMCHETQGSTRHCRKGGGGPGDLVSWMHQRGGTWYRGKHKTSGFGCMIVAKCPDICNDRWFCWTFQRHSVSHPRFFSGLVFKPSCNGQLMRCPRWQKFALARFSRSTSFLIGFTEGSASADGWLVSSLSEWPMSHS